ncbi:MAG: class I SAM-dependent methyltransferase [Xanthomonadales bacterium]|nr:class I SAM-dependent methyltransferase [Xanthomonadales bacterium]
MRRIALLLPILMVAAAVQADNHSAVQAKLEAAMAADIRSEAETDRDRNRKPVETLEFFGLRDDMRVVELLPGGGWYTKLLAPVLAENGEFYVALGTGRVKERVLGQTGFEQVEVVAEDARIYRPEGSRHYVLEVDSLGVDDVDIVFTFRNYHNFGAEGRVAMNRVVFDALKPGGIYAVVDHTRRHMEGDSPENRRRMDPVLAIKEIQEAGFELVDFSDLHYRADDELRFEVGRKTVTGNTDRWTLKFRKPLD